MSGGGRESAPTRPERPAQAGGEECEQAEVALAARGLRTLRSREASQLASHLETCARCRAVAAATKDDDNRTQGRWLARLPDGELGKGPVLPIVDPQVFEVERELASGGMGRVSVAVDRRLGREVALKEMLEPDMRDRFEREAFITAHLQHPAIIPIYEAGTWPDGSAFYTMRMVAGATLQHVIEATADLPARLALLHHVIATAEALAYAHGRRIIHRDLKTTNVLVGELGETVVIDWGLARALDDKADSPTPRLVPDSLRSLPDLTRVGAVMGTPCFMAPEQARGEVTDERADVFALGAILYTLLAGKPPYLERGADADALVAKVIAGPPRPLAELAPEAPADLRAICERAMAHDMTQRYRTAREMASELRRFEAGQLLARPYGLGELIGRWFRRHRALVAVTTIALCVVAVVGAFAIVNVTRSRAAERIARRTAESALVDAERARTAAEQREAAVLEEQARVAVQRGEREAALVLLTQALARGRDTHVIRYLLGSALRDIESIEPIATKSPDEVAMVAVGQEPPLVLSHKGTVTKGAATLFKIPMTAEVARFSPDGSFMVVAGTKGLARWDIAAGTQRWILPDATDGIVAFAADVSFVALVTNGQAKIVNSETGDVKASVTLPSASVKDVVVSPGGSALAVTDDAGTVLVFSTLSLKPVAAWTVTTPQRALAFIGERRLATAGETTARLWSLDEPALPPVLMKHESEVLRLAGAATSELLVSSTKQGNVRVWSRDGTLEASLALGESLYSLVVSPDERMVLATTGNVATARFLPGLDPGVDTTGYYMEAEWSAGSDRFILNDPQNSTVTAMRAPHRRNQAVFPADRGQLLGSQVLVVKDGAGRLTTLAGSGPQPVTPPPAGKWITSTDGKRLVVLGTEPGDHQATLYDPVVGHVIAKFEDVGSASLSPQGNVLALTDASLDGRRVRIVDAVTGSLVVEKRFPEQGEPVELALLSDRELLVGRAKMGWEIWDPRTLTGRALTTDEFGKASSAYVAPNGRIVLYERDELRVTVHDPAHGELLATFTPRDDTKHVKASRAGDVFALQAESGVVDIFTVASPARPRASISPVKLGAFALSGDGRFLFTGHSDGGVSVWDADTGREIDHMRGHVRRVVRLQLSADDSTLLVDAADEKMSLWDVTVDHHALSELEERVRRIGWTYADGVARPPGPR